MAVLPSARFSVVNLDDAANEVQDIKSLVRSINIAIDIDPRDITGIASGHRRFASGIEDHTVTMSGIGSFGTDEIYDVVFGNSSGVRTLTATIEGDTYSGEFMISRVEADIPEGGVFGFRTELRPAGPDAPAWS